MSPQLSPANAAIRGTRVGASEVAALLECGHPYLTAGDVYARLVHGVYRPSSTIMQMGHDLEAVTLKLGAERVGGGRWRRNTRTFVHRNLPLAATPDAMRPGELAEVKVVSHWAADDWAEGVPPHVQAQCDAQMLVTGRRLVHVFALMEGSRVATHTVEWNEYRQSAIALAVLRFRDEHLLTGKPPEDLPGELVLTVSGLEGTVVVDSGDLADYGNRVAELVLLRKAAEKSEEEARGALALGMAAAGAAQVIGPDWVAATSTSTTTGQVGLRFTSKRKGDKAA